MGKGLEGPREEQLRALGLFSLEGTEGGHCGLQQPHEEQVQISSPVSSDRTRGNGCSCGREV